MSYEKYYPGGWQSGESGGTPITPEALNHIETGIKQTYSDFAPAGYGWGEGRPSSHFTTNNVNRTAVFVSAGEDMPTNDSAWLCEFYATSSDGSGNYGHMVATCQGGIAKGCICYRLRANGVYGEWEWLNPPMVPGVEYRTTKRHNGKAVWVKSADIGSLITKNIESFIATGCTEIVDVHLNRVFSGVRVTPWSDNPWCWVEIVVDADKNYSSIPAVLTVEWTKD